HRCIDLGGAVIRHHGHPEIREPRPARPPERELPSCRLDLVRPRQYLQGNLEILRAAGQRTDDGDVRPGELSRETVPARRTDSPRRLVAVDTAVVGRIPDGRADVAADVQCAQARRDGGGRAAGGAAWCPRGVPGIAGGAVDWI